MSKYGPTKGELIFRLAFSLVGLGAMAFAVSLHGVRGLAWIEVVGIASVFFGGSALWSIWKLWRRDYPE